jgi:hypothetical protein
MHHFKGKIGQGHVERRDYTISSETGRLLVGSEEWGSVVNRGTVLVMSMVVKRIALKNRYATRQRNICPRCYETNIGVLQDEGWAEWYA